MIHSKIPKLRLGTSGARALFGGTGGAVSLEVASFALTKNFRRPRRHFERVFARELIVFALEFAPQSGPGTP